jgi:hypothetical protein
MHTILSYGMGVESTAILVRWLEDASVRPCPLHELIAITAQTGDEYEDTRRDIEAHVLPMLRRHNIRYVQVARRGHSQTDGIVILSDTPQPQRLFLEGGYKLSDELRAAGTVPQFGGEHICSLKFKAWVIEQWMADHLAEPARHAFGYNAAETKRVAKSEAAQAKRIAFGFNAEERKRIDRAASYDSPLRQSFYPLVEWGWTRQDCIDYLRRELGLTWRKSACVQCPFNSLTDDALARHREHPEQVADAMLLEHVSLSLNPRGTLYRDQGLIEIAEACGNQPASAYFRQRLERQSWTVYRVRRLYRAGKDKHGNPSPTKKGNAIRAVERLAPDTDRAAAIENLRSLAEPDSEIVELRSIRYVYRERCGASYPTREEFLVAAPAVVEAKARYGLEWFERQWQSPQPSLFE